MKKILAMLLTVMMILGITSGVSFAETAKWTAETTADGWIKVTQEGGETLGYTADSSVTIIEADGYAFKDLDKDGELDVYEDWRKSSEERAADLTGQMEGAD